MVFWTIENATGGEILVPKIPSYRITDLAEAIGPECDRPVIGIRAGEKIHEEMIVPADSFNTVDIGNYYAILPQDNDRVIARLKERFTVKPVQQGFHYNSGTNEAFLTVEQLRLLIRDNVDASFTV